MFNVVPIPLTLRPVKTGTLVLTSLTATIVVELAPQRGRRESIFDDFFQRTEQQQLSLATDAQDLQILPLPKENAPADFNGAVGTYAMTVTAGPTNVMAGDPVTVHVQIAGRGALDSLTLPDQPAWQDFKTFPPTSKVETTDSMGLRGTKTFEQVIVPQSPDIKQLPPLSFSYSNPEQKARPRPCGRLRFR